MKQTSSDKRLSHLFQRYNQLYWNGQLPEYRIAPVSDLGSFLGRCDARTRTIQIDVAKHKSARELRSTLLHEMCHLSAHRNGSRGHDAKFFEQLEHLLRKKAPISIADPEAGMAPVQSELVPAQFPLLKRKMGRIAAKQRKPVERFIKAKKLKVRDISDEEIIREFEYRAPESTWKEALWAVGFKEHHLTDETCRPLNSRFQRLLDKAQKAHARARRRHHLEERETEEIQRFLKQPPNERREIPRVLARETEKFLRHSRPRSPESNRTTSPDVGGSNGK